MCWAFLTVILGIIMKQMCALLESWIFQHYGIVSSGDSSVNQNESTLLIWEFSETTQGESQLTLVVFGVWGRGGQGTERWMNLRGFLRRQL